MSDELIWATTAADWCNEDIIAREWWLSHPPGAHRYEIWGPGNHMGAEEKRTVIAPGEYYIYTHKNNFATYKLEAGPFTSLDAAKLAYRMLRK
jgi:hypothetical protein